MNLFHVVEELGLTVEEVDKLTGPVIGRPKSATFRTVDVVGLDTLVHTSNGVHDNAPKDEMHETFKIPSFITKMMENKWLGTKTRQGFYKSTKNAAGKREILALDLNTMDYRPKTRAKFATLEQTKTIDNVLDRYKVLGKRQRQSWRFLTEKLLQLFSNMLLIVFPKFQTIFTP